MDGLSSMGMKKMTIVMRMKVSQYYCWESITVIHSLELYVLLVKTIPLEHPSPLIPKVIVCYV